MATFKETVTIWANDHADEPVRDWDFDLVDLIVDEIPWEDLEDSEEVLDAVRERISDLSDDPEYYGVTFPVYTWDIEKIFDSNNDVEERAVEVYGSLSEAIEGLESLDEIKARMTYMYLDQCVRDVLYTMETKLDELEDALGDLD